MSWATVAGLTVLVTVALPVIYFVQEVLRHRRRDALDNLIQEVDDALSKAIDEDPCNLAEHQRLRAELQRLRKRRNTL